MPLTTIIFLLLMAMGTLLLLWLSLRQSRHIAQHRDAVPSDFAEVITLANHQHAAAYSIAKGQLERIELVYGALLALGWTLGGGIDALTRWGNALGFSPLMSGVCTILGFLVLSSVFGIPLALYRTFVTEVRFGFNKTTPRIFVTDLLTSTLLTICIGGPIIAAFLWVMDVAGQTWWIYGWVLLNAIQLLAIWIYPTYIAPLFNRFSPLTDPDLVNRIEGLLARTGFASSGLFVMDASKRSGHGNAYFTGLGPVKRIVFFDTLLSQLDGPQIEAVLAHELGHDKKNHIPKMVVGMALLSFVGFALIGWLMQQPWLFTDLGVTLPTTASALLLAVVCLPACTYMLDPLQAWWSRRHEFEADAYAVEHTSVDAMAGALVGIYRENAGTLTPDPLYAAWHYSHPPASERVAHIRRASAS
ncbi:MAG: hypothetical protein RLY87_1129 [Chloroflexota bacterium]|jgi:STE24 endopeptidase